MINTERMLAITKSKLQTAIIEQDTDTILRLNCVLLLLQADLIEELTKTLTEIKLKAVYSNRGVNS